MARGRPARRDAGHDLTRVGVEAEACMSMFMRHDSHAIGASAFKEGRRPEWPNHGL